MPLRSNTVAFMVAMATSLVASEGLETVPKAVCPPDFSSLGESCYYFSDTVETYAQALSLCLGMAAEEVGQSYLAVLGADYEEYRHVANHILQNYKGEVWVGLSDVHNEGDWVWLNGMGLSKASSMWSCDMPRDSSTYNCATLELVDTTPVQRLLLTDKLCSAQYLYVCEYSEE